MCISAPRQPPWPPPAASLCPLQPHRETFQDEARLSPGARCVYSIDLASVMDTSGISRTQRFRSARHHHRSFDLIVVGLVAATSDTPDRYPRANGSCRVIWCIYIHWKIASGHYESGCFRSSVVERAFRKRKVPCSIHGGSKCPFWFGTRSHRGGMERLVRFLASTKLHAFGCGMAISCAHTGPDSMHILTPGF